MWAACIMIWFSCRTPIWHYKYKPQNNTLYTQKEIDRGYQSINSFIKRLIEDIVQWIKMYKKFSEYERLLEGKTGGLPAILK